MPDQRQSRRRSSIWSVFTRIDDNSAKCHLCFQILSIKGGSLFNLVRHIRTRHHHEVNEITLRSKKRRINDNSRIQSISLKETDNSSPSKELCKLDSTLKIKLENKLESVAVNPFSNQVINGENDTSIERDIVELLVKDYLPFELIDSPIFKKFCNLLNPHYELPTKKTIKNIFVPDLYNKTKERLMNVLNSIETVCITIDGWTSINTENFISLTAHFINKENQMNKVLLDCFKYETNNQSVENLTEELLRISEQWKLSEKIVTVVTNNEPNIIEAVKRANWNHIPCFGHTLNLIVQTALKQIGDVHIKIKKIVDFFKKDTEASEKLTKMQTQLKQPEINLKSDHIRRWNSTIDMFQKVIESKLSLMSTIAINYPEMENITGEDINVIQKCCDILEIFKDVTEEISNETQVTSSKIILLTNALKKFCTKFLEDNQNLSTSDKTFINCLLEELKEKFENIERNEIFSQATFLDPRFKKHGFSSNKYFDDTKQNIENCISVVAHKDKISKQEIKQVDESKSSLLWMNFDENVSKSMSMDNINCASYIEVEKYLQEPLLERCMDPLNWWEDRKSIYPRLYRLARQQLSIVATCVPSQHFFSKTEQMLTQEKSCLIGDNVSKIVFLNVNM